MSYKHPPELDPETEARYRLAIYRNEHKDSLTAQEYEAMSRLIQSTARGTKT